MARSGHSSEDLDAIIARTALKYDLLPYQSKPFAQSQPARLGALARLFGLAAAPLATARVLELGCASDGNIIPLAFRYPAATFVGIDLARTQVAAGRSRIAELELHNIEIHCQSFTEISDELGQFDYVVCHGVYSWVPALVQDAIMRIVRARLSPVGVACISYNVLPGWRMMQPLRDAFLLEIPDHVDSLGRVARARELLDFLSKSSPDKGPYGDMIRQWATRLKDLPDDYIAHEFLEETNAPSTLREFVNGAAAHGLGYLGECELSSMILDNYGSEVAEQVRARTSNNLIESEQYLDLLSGRTFRQSLLVSSERLATANRSLSSLSLVGLHYLSSAGLKVDRKQQQGVVTDAVGRTLTSDSTAVIAGIERLIARFPASSTLDQCAGDCEPAERESLAEALYQMVIAGMLHLLSEPVDAEPAVSDKPCAIPLARADAVAGRNTTTNNRHESVSLDSAALVLLPAIDGTRDHAALADVLAQAGRAGELGFNRDGEPISDPAVITTIAASLLAGIAAVGLLES